jgi:homoserine O-acetyltransferase
MRLTLFATLLLAAASLRAADYPPPVAHDFVVKDYRFVSGETLPEVKIHYVTLGTKGAGNTVLVLHGTGGSSKQFLSANFAGVLFAPGGLLDASKHFIVIPDNIGHGESSKPSDGLHARFPHYDYDDMVDLQHRLLTEGLGVDHLRLVIGTSMGGMQSWMWGERWPRMMDGLVPLASLPSPISGRNRVWRKMAIDNIRTDPEWQNGDYTKQPRGVIAATQLLLVVGGAPLYWQRIMPTRDDADQWLEKEMTRRLPSQDANDLLYALDSSRNYDPSKNLEKITAPLLAINSTDDFINPPELGIMEAGMKRVKYGRYVLLPVSDQTRGHGTHTWPAVWGGYLAEFLGKLP